MRKVLRYWFTIMWNSIFPSASLLSGTIMETVFVWWQANRPALFRLVSAIMKKHHQLRMGALCCVYRNTQQIMTIDCYPETRKKTQSRGKRQEMWNKDIDYSLLQLPICVSPIKSKCLNVQSILKTSQNFLIKNTQELVEFSFCRQTVLIQLLYMASVCV